MSDCAGFRAAACLFGALLMGCVSASAELKPEDIYQTVLPSVLTLEVQNATGQHFIGTAFLASSNGIAVTAWHVIHDAVRVTARFADNRDVSVLGLVAKDVGNDVALIKVEAGGRPGVTLTPKRPRVGAQVYVIGAPKGFDFSIAEGLVSQIRTVDGVEYYQLSCPISPGDSGGPVLNDRGQVIGLVSWRKADAESVSFAIPATDVARLNASGVVQSWRQETLTAAAELPSAKVSHPEARAVATPAPADRKGDYQDFKRILAAQAGKRVSVTLHAGDQNSRFDFTVPVDAGK